MVTVRAEDATNDARLVVMVNGVGDPCKLLEAQRALKPLIIEDQ